MKEHNLLKLLDSCCVTIPRDVKEALFDYLIDYVDLNEVNIDDIYINNVYFLNKDEYDPNQHTILVERADEVIVI